MVSRGGQTKQRDPNSKIKIKKSKSFAAEDFYCGMFRRNILWVIKRLGERRSVSARCAFG